MDSFKDDPLAQQERDMARIVGATIGYGRMMRLGEELWRESLIKQGHSSGGEHTTGPCAAFMVPCGCKNRVKCDWCCGSGRVTKLVRDVQRHRWLVKIILWISKSKRKVTHE